MIMHGKNAFFLVLSLAACLLNGCASLQHPGDEWVARDKAQHFAATALISAGTAWALTEAGAEDAQAYAGSVAIGISAGAAKEIYDREVKNTYWSGKDFIWDILGALAGGLIVTGL